MRSYTPAPSPCTEDATGGRCGLKIQLIPASRPTELTAFQPDVTTLAPGRTQGIHTIQNIPLDYRISFEINPHQSVESGWSNILHVTATGQNCCAYGDRLPGIWFYPGGTEPCTSYSCPGHRLHIVHGHRDSGNDDCSPPDELPYGRFTTVQVDIRQKHVEVFYDGLSKCTEPRGETETFNSAHIYVSDHWHPAARATVQNMALEQLVPVLGCTKELACDYNPRASVDDGSCTMVQPGYACGVANQIAPPDGHGPWRFITSPRQLSNTQGQQLHAMVHLPLDYTIHFDITPDNSQNPAWTSVLHFSATGANCCEYGDRVPAVYFYPGQKRFHIIDGQPSVGNDEYETSHTHLMPLSHRWRLAHGLVGWCCWTQVCYRGYPDSWPAVPRRDPNHGVTGTGQNQHRNQVHRTQVTTAEAQQRSRLRERSVVRSCGR